MSPKINFYRKKEQRVQHWLLSWWLQVTHQIWKKQQKNRQKRVISWLSIIGVLSSVIILTAIFSPDLFYSIVPFQRQVIEASYENSSLTAGDWSDGALYATITLPPKDSNLPEGKWLVIPKLGVRTQINEKPEENMEEALRLGVWRVPDFGDPMNLKGPMILVAHRFGYLKWTNQYRRENSFYNLSKLEIGDTFEVIWDQRRFTYEVYAGEEGEEITDYGADIILYTCKHLNSSVRYFRYARRASYE